MIILQLFILSLPLAILFVLANRNHAWLEMLPSIFWYFFISLPFIFLVNFLDGYFLVVQFIGIVIISLSLLISDFIGMQTFKLSNINFRTAEKWIPSKSRKRLLVAVIISFLLAIPVIHIMTTHTFPISQFFFSHTGGFDLADARQKFTKGAQLPLLSEVLIAWYIPLVSTLGIYLLWRLGYRLFSFFSLIYISFYSIVGLEKIPFVFLIFSLLIAFVYRYGSKIKLQKRVIIGITGILILLTSLGQLYVSQVNRDNNFKNSSEYESSKLLGYLTPSDTYRFDVRPVTSIPGPVIGLTYRTVLTPIDVSFRFYQYFSLENEFKRDLLEIITLKEKPKGTNLVGNWAFTDRFPSKYTKYIDAYSSIDADSFSIFGIFGVLIAGMLLVVLRICFVQLRSKSHFGVFAYGVFISYISFMPFQSGVTSMLLSKGLLVLLFLTWAVGRIYSRRQSLQPHHYANNSEFEQ